MEALTRAVRRWAARLRLSAAGAYVAVGYVCLSLTPSLLPRTWPIQGLVSGLSASLGYATGVGVASVARRIVRGHHPPPLPQWTRFALPLVAAMTLASFLYRGSHWQRELYLLMGRTPQPRLSYTGVFVVTALLLAASIGLARALRAASRGIARLLARVVAPRPARVGGAATVALLSAALLGGLLQNGVLQVISESSAGLNDSPGPAAVAPTTPMRSGSPASLVTWESLGMQGRSFVTGGPTVAQLTAFSGTRAQEPIRVYVGLESAPDLPGAAALAVRELERTGAFDRSILVVVTSTGTGWIDPYIAAALEYMHNGDTAMVSLQYSYLPSWVMLLTDRARVEDAGRELFEQVHQRWSARPESRRPRLLVFGESLGSLGSEAAFTGLDDLRARTDGAVLAGPTGANSLWKQLMTNRDPGSPQVLPTCQNGQTVRFASEPTDLLHPDTPWLFPRVVYLQNPSDPVTWWSPRLLVQRPDWLGEPRGHDVLPAMRWYPVLTFLQVTADLALAAGAPQRHGHDFRAAAVAAWAAIAPAAGWTVDRSEDLTRILDRQAEAV